VIIDQDDILDALTDKSDKKIYPSSVTFRKKQVVKKLNHPEA
jgi:hypothetical protein